MEKSKILIVGKLPPPYFGPAVATQIILKSSLNTKYVLDHVNNNAHDNVVTFGTWKIEKIFNNLSIYYKMYRKVQNFQPDLVLVPVDQSTIGFLKDSIIILIARLRCSKILIQLRGSNWLNWFDASSFFTKLYVRLVLKATCGVIVLGNNLKYLFADFFTQERIFVVANGANLHFPERNKKSNKIKILYLSNLMPSKGIQDLLIALTLLKDKVRNLIDVEVVGEWADLSTREECLSLIGDNCLPVSFYHKVFGDAKIPFLCNADIFIFAPRLPEGMPWVIIEALAAGLPIISTDQGAITEAVSNGLNGFIVPPCSPAAIAEKLELLICSESLRLEMSQQSKLAYSEKFTEDVMVNNFIKCFEKVLCRDV